jgi:hypothetical protein
MALLQTLTQEWRARLDESCADQPERVRSSILQWLLGENPERFNQLNPTELRLVCSGMDYRYRILTERYLRVSPEKAHELLMRRFASLPQIRHKVSTLVEQSRDRQRTVMQVVQEVIQEMLENDRYLQEQCKWIHHCTPIPRLRNILLFTNLEEYGLRPVNNQPLIIYRTYNHLKRSQRGGLTQVPSKQLIHLSSEQMLGVMEDDFINLSDPQAIAQHEQEQAELELNLQRRNVQKSFEQYLAQELGETAVQWFRLYIQGYTQESIAQRLQVPIRQMYRLREKISYHAIRIFSVRIKPDLVAEWLNTSLQEHCFGLTPRQWSLYRETLSSYQCEILDALKAGETLETIAVKYETSTNQIMAEWGKLFLAAQQLRNSE